MVSGRLDGFAQAIALRQAGVISRGQLLAVGCTDSMLDAQVRARRWQRLHPGVFAVFNGPVPDDARVWAALLHCGDGATTAGLTAAWLCGLVDEAPRVVDVNVPGHRRVVPRAGVRIHRDRRLELRRHPTQRPARLRVEELVLDMADAAERIDDVAGWITRACQRRLTTPDRLEQARLLRPRLRRRALIGEILQACRDGVASALEHRWRRDVERAHGLPVGARNRADGPAREALLGHRGTVYRDVRYRRFGVVVELDGRLSHPFEDRGRDARRDRQLALAGETTLRYDWGDVADRPCRSAGELAAMLQAHGWMGQLRPCGPSCAARLDALA